MRRGEIRRVDFDPARGSGVGKRRPAVIVSNEGANLAASRHGRGVLVVVPLTSNVTMVEPYQVFVPASASGLGADSKAQAEQIRAVDVSCVGPLIGSIPPPLMREINDALRLQLVL